MLFVFFACGDDDDDSSSGAADDDLDPDTCEELRQHAFDCVGLVSADWTPSVVFLNANCFREWCEGSGTYDLIGNLSHYDFAASCFPEDCAALYDIEMDASHPLYDDCSNRFLEESICQPS
ncbi:MAG: hypothetical protein M5R36_28010 [Deltaproteobacteria bacterium]|nr:hypothetical protein [Deltaproteobacteria bacterium]